MAWCLLSSQLLNNLSQQLVLSRLLWWWWWWWWWWLLLLLLLLLSTYICGIMFCFPIYTHPSRSPVQERLQLITQKVKDGKQTPGPCLGGMLFTCAIWPNVSNARNPGWLGYIGYHTTQLCGDYDKLLWGSLLITSRMESKSCFLSGLLWMKPFQSYHIQTV